MKTKLHAFFPKLQSPCNWLLLSLCLKKIQGNKYIKVNSVIADSVCLHVMIMHAQNKPVNIFPAILYYSVISR